MLMNGGMLKANIQLVLGLNGRSKKICCCEEGPTGSSGWSVQHANDICTITA